MYVVKINGVETLHLVMVIIIFHGYQVYIKKYRITKKKLYNDFFYIYCNFDVYYYYYCFIY